MGLACSRKVSFLIWVRPIFQNRQVPSLAWVPPHLLCSLPHLAHAPHLHVPFPSALPILSTQTRGSKGELPPPFPGTPFTHTPLPLSLLSPHVTPLSPTLHDA